MKTSQQGFTLIELIVVIMILGILAATALPKFIDMSSDAKTAAIQGAAGALSSSSAINFSAAMLRGTTGAGVVNLSGAASAAAAFTSGVGGWETNKFVIATEANCSGSTAGATQSAGLSYSAGSTANTAKATIVCTG